jgi:microcystin-dependent protein
MTQQLTPKNGLPYYQGTDLADGATQQQALAVKLDTLRFVQIGSIMMWPTGVAPNTDWLLCNGNTNVLSSDYPLLVAILGETGVPAKLKIPDFTGRFPAGAGQPVGGGLSAGVNDPTNGSLLVPGGEGKHTLAAIETAIRNHQHPGTTGANTSISHRHDVGYGNNGAGGVAVSVISIPGTFPARTQTDYAEPPAHTHGFTTGDPNGGQVNGTAHENRPPFLPVSFIILGR